MNVQNAKVIWSQAKETKEEKERQAEMKKQAKQKHKKKMLSLLDLKPLPEVETPNLQNCLINCQKESQQINVVELKLVEEEGEGFFESVEELESWKKC